MLTTLEDFESGGDGFGTKEIWPVGWDIDLVSSDILAFNILTEEFMRNNGVSSVNDSREVSSLIEHTELNTEYL